MTTELDDLSTDTCDQAAAKRTYRIKTAQSDLTFNSCTLDDPVPLGRQILVAAGYATNSDYSLFAILPTGDFEGVRLDEPFDLRGRGVERFVVFSTDTLYKFRINDAQIQWGEPILLGSLLYTLANPKEVQGLFLRVPGGTDRLINPEDELNLSDSGVEHFITARKPVTHYEVIINARKFQVSGPEVTFEQIVKLAFPQSSTETNATFSMTFRCASSLPSASELGAGGNVTVQTIGTIFNVTRTVKS